MSTIIFENINFYILHKKYQQIKKFLCTFTFCAYCTKKPFIFHNFLCNMHKYTTCIKTFNFLYLFCVYSTFMQYIQKLSTFYILFCIIYTIVDIAQKLFNFLYLFVQHIQTYNLHKNFQLSHSFFVYIAHLCILHKNSLGL